MGPNKAAGNLVSIPFDDGLAGLLGATIVRRKKPKANRTDPARERKRDMAKASRKRNRR